MLRARSSKHTVHWSSLTPIAVVVTAISPLESMGIEHIFPISNFSDFLIAVLVFFIVVWSSWIVDVIPILRHLFSIPILFPLLTASTLSLLVVEVVGIIVVSCPICQRRFNWLRSLRSRYWRFWRADSIFCRRRWRWSSRARYGCRRSELARYSLCFGLLSRNLGSSCGLELQGGCCTTRGRSNPHVSKSISQTSRSYRGANLYVPANACCFLAVSSCSEEASDGCL
jgi:hypothetical protein